MTDGFDCISVPDMAPVSVVAQYRPRTPMAWANFSPEYVTIRRPLRPPLPPFNGTGSRFQLGPARVRLFEKARDDVDPFRHDLYLFRRAAIKRPLAHLMVQGFKFLFQLLNRGR